MLGLAGDVAVSFGLVWHYAMPNDSGGDRSAIPIQYLPKFVKPMRDQVRGLQPDVLGAATPLLRQLIGLDFPYPRLLDQVEATVEVGALTQ